MKDLNEGLNVCADNIVGIRVWSCDEVDELKVID